MNYIRIMLLLLIINGNNIQGQDSIDNRKNAITYNLFQLDRSLSFAYYRKLNSKIEFVINARIKDDQQKSRGHADFFMPDPYGYKRFLIRMGLLIYSEGAYIEPIIEYDKGSFKNETRDLEDYDGDLFDVSQTEDREYNSMGVLILGGYNVIYKFITFRIYSGIGIHERFYHRIQYQKYGWYGPIEDGIHYPFISDYSKIVYTLHLGIEVGIRF